MEICRKLLQKALHGFQRQLESARAGAPVSWKKISLKIIFSGTLTAGTPVSWEKMLELTPIEKVPIVSYQSFFGGSCKNR